MEFKREDYIYLRYLEDDFENHKKKGDIIRYTKEQLIDNLVNRQFGYLFRQFEDKVEFVKNNDALEDDVMYDKVYKSIKVTEDINSEICLWEGDYLYLDEWFYNHLFEFSIPVIENITKEYLPDSNNTNKLVKLKDGSPYVNGNIRMHFKKGELLDFSNPSVAVLLYNPSYLELFSKTELITGEEKQTLFEKNFKDTIFEVEKKYCTFHNERKCEQRIYKIKDKYRFKEAKDLNCLLERFYISTYNDNEIIRDKEGYITHIVYSFKPDDNNFERLYEEESIEKIAERLSAEEALVVYQEECERIIDEDRKHWEQIAKEEKEREQKERKQIKKAYESQKNNADIFPGTHGEFKHSDRLNESNGKYTLEQIKEFFKKLSKLNPEIVKHMCIYGGTIPYLLTNPNNCREFGDIDIFIPIQYMDKLRKMFAEEDSFYINCDSKEFTEFCMLTTKIPKEDPKSIVVREEQDGIDIQDLYDSFVSFMTPSYNKKYFVDEEGIVHSPIYYHKEEELPYYKVLQDFGFKGSLFGINISVFPMYEYKDNLMAKSFNANNEKQYLLGVKIMNDTKIDKFIKNINICGTNLKMMPLEYTLVSKEGAIKDKYYKRYEKDQEDIKYILEHKDELGIDDELLEEIRKKYPDYSVSIAYTVTDPVQIVDGNTYKKLLFTNVIIS